MSNSKFRVGDDVAYVGEYNGSNHQRGLQGRVIRVDSEGDVVVQLSTAVGGSNTQPLWTAGNISKIVQVQKPTNKLLHDLNQKEANRLATTHALPTDSEERKTYPMFSGLLGYFPAALGEVSHHSYLGNEKHNPGKELQHARGKSGDHEDCIVRHLVDAKEFAPGSNSRIEELRACAWRALALLQEECEKAGAPIAPAATFGDSLVR